MRKQCDADQDECTRIVLFESRRQWSLYGGLPRQKSVDYDQAKEPPRTLSPSHAQTGVDSTDNVLQSGHQQNGVRYRPLVSAYRITGDALIIGTEEEKLPVTTAGHHHGVPNKVGGVVGRLIGESLAQSTDVQAGQLGHLAALGARYRRPSPLLSFRGSNPQTPPAFGDDPLGIPKARIQRESRLASRNDGETEIVQGFTEHQKSGSVCAIKFSV
jgi:hypothetical protein